MPLLYLQTDQVRQTSNQLTTTAQTIREACTRISSAWSAMIWDAPGAYQFFDELSAVINRLNGLADDAVQLAYRLRREADEWETAGRGVPTAWSGYTGSMSSQAYVYSMIAAGGGAAAAAQMSAFEQIFGGLSQWISGLLTKVGWIPQSSVISPMTEEENPPRPWLNAGLPAATPKTSFGDLLAAMEAERALTPAQSLAKNSLDVPLLGQGTLGGSAACAPTSIGMVMSFWHDQNSSNPTASPNKLYEASKAAGYFEEGKGMDFSEIQQLFQSQGYEAEMRTLEPREEISIQEQVHDILKDGPIIAQVKLGFSGASGDSQAHAVVVTGISSDGSLVRINDPWKAGEVKDMTWEKFVGSWESFSDQFDNTVVIARPKGN